MKHLSVIFLLLVFCPISLVAQPNHVLGRSVMEVSYHEVCGKHNDDFALRIGKSISQYFSYHGLRNDSLGTNPQSAMIIIQEMLDEANNRNDASKQRPSGPGHGDYLYRDQDKGTFATYTSIMGQGYRITEPIPVQDWSISVDSTRQILGYHCHMATATFRGRRWVAYYTEDIPVSLGPWKLGGLPGLILSAKVDGYISIEATSIRTKDLSPVTFYNFFDKKFDDIERTKYLKAKNDPKAYPPKTIITPQMELE